MIVSPYVFKSKAVRALKGNWQTALLVSFFASLPMTIVQLAQTTKLPDLASLTTPEAMTAAIGAVSPQTWSLLGLIGGLSLVISPVLTIGCNHYFVRRIQGEELGFRGLFSRMGGFGKAFLLYALMYVKTLLWSLLLVVPGIMAALRYSLAPFYLAENPDMGVLEAIRKSKETMQGRKLSLFMLDLSFVFWLLGAMLAELLLSGISVILALVVSQFIQLVMAAYLNAACASFYLAASVPDGMQTAQLEASAWLRSLGGGFGGFNRTPFGNDDNSDDIPDDGDAQEREPENDGDAGEGESLGGERDGSGREGSSGEEGSGNPDASSGSESSSGTDDSSGGDNAQD